LEYERRSHHWILPPDLEERKTHPSDAPKMRGSSKPNSTAPLAHHRWAAAIISSALEENLKFIAQSMEPAAIGR